MSATRACPSPFPAVTGRSNRGGGQRGGAPARFPVIRRGGVAEASAPGFDRADASADALARRWLSAAEAAQKSAATPKKK